MCVVSRNMCAVASATRVKDLAHICTDEYIVDMFLTNVVAETGELNGHVAEVKLRDKTGSMTYNGGVRFLFAGGGFPPIRVALSRKHLHNVQLS
jgi:hypothetical protein